LPRLPPAASGRIPYAPRPPPAHKTPIPETPKRRSTPPPAPALLRIPPPALPTAARESPLAIPCSLESRLREEELSRPPAPTTAASPDRTCGWTRSHRQKTRCAPAGPLPANTRRESHPAARTRRASPPRPRRCTRPCSGAAPILRCP